MTAISPETQSDLYTLAQGPDSTLFHDPADLEQFGGDCHRLADDMIKRPDAKVVSASASTSNPKRKLSP